MADVYRFVKDTFDGVESYAIYSASGINTGDMMQWDPVAGKAVNAALASGSIFLGVAEETNPLRSLGTPERPLTGGKIRIKSSGIFRFLTTNGETYSHLDAVFQGSDVQTVNAGSSPHDRACLVARRIAGVRDRI